MPIPKRETLGDELAWIYAKIAIADMALKNGAAKYSLPHYMVRSKLYKGLSQGTMNISSFFKDEKLKIEMSSCCYCGSIENLSLDHILPRKKLGSDLSENLILACQSCNSSKGSKDLITWLVSMNKFPSIHLLRRYLKLIYFYCQSNDFLSVPLNNISCLTLPFDLLPLKKNMTPLHELPLLNLHKCTDLPKDYFSK